MPSPDTFKVSCGHCGHTVQVDQRAVGKEIQCQRCGKKFAVIPPAPELLTVTCTCGKKYKVPASQAGKRAKCNTCGAQLVIPSVENPASSPQEAAKTDEIPISAQEPDEPTRSFNGKLPIVVGAVALLVGISLTLFWLGRNSNLQTPTAQAPPRPVNSSPLQRPNNPISPASQPVAIISKPRAIPSASAPTTQPVTSVVAKTSPPATLPAQTDSAIPPPASLGEVNGAGEPIGNPRELLRFTDEKGHIAVAFAPNGKLMAITGSNGLSVREVPSGKVVHVLTTIKYPNSVCFSPDGTHVLWNNTTDRITLYSEIETGHDLQRFGSPNAYMSAISISPDGKLAAVASGDQKVRVWDIESGSLRSTLIAVPPYTTHTMAFSPNSRQLITGGENKGLHLWDVATGKDLQRFVGQKGEVNAVVFSPDGKFFVSGGGVHMQKDGRWVFDGDNDIHLWNPDSGQEIKHLTGHKNWVQDLAITPNGEYLVSASGITISMINRQPVTSDDNTIRVWKLSTGREFQIFRGHENFVSSIAISPDCHYVLSSSGDHTARLWLLPEEVWDDRPADAVIISERRNLPAITRRFSGEVTPLIEDKKWDEATTSLKDIENDLRELAVQSNLPLWDTTVSPIFRLIDSKRTLIQTKRAESGSPAEGKTAATRPAARTPEQNRKLGEIRTALSQVETLTRQKKLVQAQTALYKAQDDLKKFTEAEQIPEWVAPIAVLFQTAATRQDSIEEARTAEEAKAEALVEAERLRKAKAQPGTPQTPTVVQGLQPGQPAPGFNAITLNGSQFATQQFKGKYVLLDFWATWCGPCRAEIPFLKETYETYGRDKRFILISLSIDSQVDTPAQFAVQNQMNWIQAFLGDHSQVATLYQVRSIPSIMLIGPDGRILATRLRGDNIKKKVGEVLAAVPAR